jgi:hypothetical protein
MPSSDRAISPIKDWNNSCNLNTNCSSLRSNEDQIYLSPSRCHSLNDSGSSTPSGLLVKRGFPLLVIPRLKRTLSIIPSSNELEHQMSVPDIEHPVTPVESFSERNLHSVEDLNACLSQCAFSDFPIDNFQNNLIGSFNFKPLLESPKCSPKRTFKVKILKDDNNDDDLEVQYTGKGPIKNAIKIAEYEGKPVKMRKFHKSPSNRCGRPSRGTRVLRHGC